MVGQRETSKMPPEPLPPLTRVRRNFKWRWLVKCKLVLMPSKANYRIIPPPPLVCSFTGTRQGRWRDLATIKKRNWHTVPLQNKGRKRRERPRFCSNLEFALSFNRELGNLSVSCSKLCRIWVVGGRGSSIMRGGNPLRISSSFSKI